MCGPPTARTVLILQIIDTVVVFVTSIITSNFHPIKVDNPYPIWIQNPSCRYVEMSIITLTATQILTFLFGITLNYIDRGAKKPVMWEGEEPLVIVKTTSSDLGRFPGLKRMKSPAIAIASFLMVFISLTCVWIVFSRTCNSPLPSN